MADYVERVSHREHRAWCFYEGILKLPKKQSVLPDGTPFGPRPVTKEDIAKMNRWRWQQQVTEKREERLAKEAAQHRAGQRKKELKEEKDG